MGNPEHDAKLPVSLSIRMIKLTVADYDFSVLARRRGS